MSGYSAFAEFYDELTRDVDYRKYADYLCGLLRQNGIEKGLVLDLACGTGSLTVELAKRGYELIGVDSSPEMLSEAQKKAFGSNVNLLLLCQEMKNLDLYGTVDAAVCTLDSINHVTDPKTVSEIFSRVSLFLNPGGVFIFDVNTPYKHSEILNNNTFVYDLDDIYCVWQNQYRPETCEVDIFLDFFKPDGEKYTRESEEFSERAYSDEEIRTFAGNAGLMISACYDELSQSRPNVTSQRLNYIAKKI